MKPQEAIDAIRYNMPPKGAYEDLTEALHMAIGLFEMQIAQKPVFNPKYEYYRCSYCNYVLEKGEYRYSDFSYCPVCGQKIDWEETL